MEIHFDSIEGQAWMNRVFQERLNELEVGLFDTAALRTEEATNMLAISTFGLPCQETRLGSVPAVPQAKQSSIDQEQSSDVLDRLGESPSRRTFQFRRRLGPVNQTDTTSATPRSKMTTIVGREERRPDRSYLMWSRPIPGHISNRI